MKTSSIGLIGFLSAAAIMAASVQGKIGTPDISDSYEGDAFDGNVRRMLSRRRRRRSANFVRAARNNRVLNMEPGDLNIRFSKIPMLDGYPTDALLPLGNDNFPMRGELATILKNHSNAESIMTEDDFELHMINERRFFSRSGGPPTYPNEDPNHSFWQDDFRPVVEALVHLRADGNPNDIMTLPNRWANFSMQEVANAVHDEYPGLWQSELLMEFFYDDVKIDYDILPFRCVDDFIGLPFRMAEINTWATMAVGPTNFRAKWTYGRPRPEEVGWLIAHGGPLAPFVPSDLLEIIDSWNITGPFDFTAYKNTGSPMHPSWPAMHSAASSATLWMSVVFDLTDDQYCQALRTDWAVSYARTVAGVHYPSDNIAGLNMGQFIVADRLEELLATRWNAPRARVRRKIQSKLVKWEDFDHVTCTFRDRSAATTN